MHFNRIILLLAVALVLLFSAPTTADAQSRDRQDQMRAWAELKAVNTNAEIFRSIKSNTPTAMFGFKSRSYSGSSKAAVARQFLAENADLLEVRSEGVNLRLLKDLYHGGIHHVSFQQVYNGKRVLDAIIQVSVNDNNEVTSFTGRHHRDIVVEEDPVISNREAIQFGESLFMLSEDQFRASSAELVVRRQLNTFAWAYVVSIGERGAIIDAATGLLIKMFLNPSGLSSTTENHNLESSLSPTMAKTSQSCTNTNTGSVYLSNPIDPLIGSGYSTGQTLNRLCGDGKSLDGEYVTIYNFHHNPLSAGIPTSTSSNFNFTPNTSTTAAPCPDPGGSSFPAHHDCSQIDDVNVYYHIDKVANDFWKTQLGVVPPKIDAMVHFLSDGTLGQAIVLYSKINFQHAQGVNNGQRVHDSAKLKQVIYHEYAHHVTFQSGLHYIGSGTGAETKALSEGYADYFAASFTNDPLIFDGAVWCPPNIPPANLGCDGSQYAHLRTLTPSPMWTYADRATLSYGSCDAQYINDPDPAECRTLIPAAATANHTVGMIWAGGLWALRGEIGANGASIVDNLALKSMMYVPGSDVEFQDAYVGLLIADQALYGGQYYNDIVKVMKTDRGIGNGAIHGPTIIAGDQDIATLAVNGEFIGQDIIIEPETVATVESTITLSPRTETIYGELGTPLGTLTHPSSIFILGDSLERGTLEINANIVCGTDSEIIAAGGDVIGAEKFQLTCENACLLAKDGGSVVYRNGSSSTVKDSAFVAINNGTFIVGDNAVLTYESSAKPLVIKTTVGSAIFKMGKDSKITFERSVSIIGTQSYPVKFEREDINEQWEHLEFRGTADTLTWVELSGGDKTIYLRSKNTILDNVNSHDGKSGMAMLTATSGGRSSVRISNSTFADNSGSGIVAVFGDLDISETVITGNGTNGVYLSFSDATPFEDNTLEDNWYGIQTDYNGVIYLDQDANNDILNNGSHEIYANKGSVYAGISTVGSGGQNNIYDTSDPGVTGKYIYNKTSTNIMAENNYWGGTPTSSQFDAPVDYTPYLGAAAKTGAPVGASLRDMIVDLRSAVEANPSAVTAEVLEQLYYLQNADKNDALRENDKTMIAISGVVDLRIRLGSGATSNLRSAGEKAMLILIRDALASEAYHSASMLVSSYSGQITSDENKAELLFYKILLAEQAGQYQEALDLASLHRSYSDLNDEEQPALSLIEESLVERIEAAGAIARQSAPINEEDYGLGKKGEIDSENNGTPLKTELGDPYPNPFNPSITLPFNLSETSTVEMTVFDVLGRRVAVIVDGLFNAGSHAAVFEASHLASGTYVVRVNVQSDNGLQFSSSRMISLQK